MSTKEEQLAQIQKKIAENDVVIYMKGTAKMPMCGFSAATVAVFNQLEVPIADVNIFDNRDMLDTLKEFSQWQTFPQIFVKGEFIGGCDILREMYAAGELQQMLDEKGISYKAA